MTWFESLCMKSLHATVHFIGGEGNILMLLSSDEKAYTRVVL